MRIVEVAKLPRSTYHRADILRKEIADAISYAERHGLRAADMIAFFEEVAADAATRLTP